METVAFLEALVRALGRGWSARYGIIAPYGVLGVTLTTDVGGTAEIVPSLVRGIVVTWSPFVFAQGLPHYDIHAGGRLFRTDELADAVAHLERWRQASGPAASVAARLARTGARRRRSTEVDHEPRVAMPPRGVASSRSPAPSRVAPASRGAMSPRDAALPSLADALRDRPLGEIRRARELVHDRDPAVAAGELLAIARRTTGNARANALGVLIAIARPEHGPELARYLGDAERSVQRVAIDGVKRTGYTAAVPALAALVLGRDSKPTSARTQLATAAATAMKALSGQRGAAALTGYLDSDDPRIREAACVAFTLSATPGTRQSRAQLERLLRDGDPRVVRAARRALAAR